MSADSQSLFVNLIAQEINQLFQNKQTESGLLRCVLLFSKEKPERFFPVQDLLLSVIMLFCGTAVLSG